MALVAQLSDIHLRREPSDPAQPGNPEWCLERTVAALRAALADRTLDLVLVTGDIADDGSLAACARARDLLAPLGAPIVAAPGNHDDRASVAEVFGTTVTVGLGDWWVELVDTVVPGAEAGAIDVGALTARLDAADGRPTVLALHHPLVTLSTNAMFQLEGAAEMIAALGERPWVRAVVSGHLHEVFNVHLGGVAHLGAPSTWYALQHEAAEFRFVDGLVGAQLLDLRTEGALTWQRIAR